MRKPNFVFRKPKGEKWSLLTGKTTHFNIFYKRVQVGWIETTDNYDGVILVYKGDSTEQQLQANPNSDWNWQRAYYKTTVDGLVSVIKDDPQSFYDKLYSKIEEEVKK